MPQGTYARVAPVSVTTTSGSIDVRELIDRSPVQPIQYWTFAVCILIAIMDGYDTSVVGVAGPALIGEGLVDAKSFGYVVSAGLAGFVPGMIVFGPAADRWGRKPLLAIAVLIFAAGSLFTGLSRDFSTLIVARLITGSGIGGAAPCFVSLAAEYSPQRLRTSIVTTLWAGVPVGGILGGMLAARFVTSADWPMLFYVGTVAPLLAVGLLVFTVPESIGYLAARGGKDERIRTILRRISGDAGWLGTTTFSAAQVEAVKPSLGSIFRGGGARMTWALWLAFFCSFGQLVMLSQYAAVLLRMTGMPSAQIGTVFSFFFVGSVLGTLSAGPIMKRLVHTTATIAVLVAAAAGSVLFGFLAGEFVSALIGITIAGFTASAAIGALVALATELYPLSIRATGVGWSLAMGRVGSTVTPLFSTVLLGWGVTQAGYYMVAGLIALVGAASVFTIHLLRSGQRSLPRGALPCRPVRLRAAQPARPGSHDYPPPE